MVKSKQNRGVAFFVTRFVNERIVDCNGTHKIVYRDRSCLYALHPHFVGQLSNYEGPFPATDSDSRLARLSGTR